MTTIKAPFFLILSLLGLLSSVTVSALPHSSHNVAQVQNVTISGRDEALTYRDLTDEIATYYRRDNTRCSSLNIEQAKKMPGWAKIEKFAKDKWGDGKWNIVTNPKEYADRGATFCIDDAPVKIQPKGKPTCHDRFNELEGTTTGTNGTSWVKIVTGQATTGSWTVKRESTFGFDVKFEAKFEIPALFEATTGITSVTRFTNSRDDSFSTTTNSQHETQVTANAPDGSKCSVKLQVKACDQGGSGRIRIAASGFIWFNYDDKRAPKADPKGDKHYKYAAKIDDVLSLEERSSWMEFDGSISGESSGKYETKCVKNGQPVKASVKAVKLGAVTVPPKAPPKKN